MRNFSRRLALCEVTSRELKLGLEMMGINVPRECEPRHLQITDPVAPVW